MWVCEYVNCHKMYMFPGEMVSVIKTQPFTSGKLFSVCLTVVAHV